MAATATVSRPCPAATVKTSAVMSTASIVKTAAGVQSTAPILTPAATIEQTTDIPQQGGGGGGGNIAPPAKMTRKRQRTTPNANEASTTMAVETDPSDSAMAVTTTPATEEKVTGSENGSWLIVAKSVRTLLKNMPENVHCSADALPMLNSRVQEILHEAAARAAGNSRKTLKPCDF
jgi:hypothetical protein